MSFFDMIYNIKDVLLEVEEDFSELRHVGEFSYDLKIMHSYANKLEILLIIEPYEDNYFETFTVDIIKLNFVHNEFYITRVECKNDYSECDEALNKSCEKILKILLNN